MPSQTHAVVSSLFVHRTLMCLKFSDPSFTLEIQSMLPENVFSIQVLNLQRRLVTNAILKLILMKKSIDELETPQPT